MSWYMYHRALYPDTSRTILVLDVLSSIVLVLDDDVKSRQRDGEEER